MVKQKNHVLSLALMALACVTMTTLTMHAAALESSIGNPSEIDSKQDGKSVLVKVRDSQGVVVGAGVVIDGTNYGTVTDANGIASLDNVLPGATIVVSFIGYVTQNLTFDGRDVFEVFLKEDDYALDELVVVGYGVQKKVNLSGSVATADSKSLESRPVANVVNALQGAVANLNIDPAKGTPGT